MTDGEFIELATRGEQGAALAALRVQPALAAARNAQGISVLCLAVYHGRPGVAAALAAARTDLDVFEAACVGDVERVKALAALDRDQLNAVSPDGFGPAGYAAFFGHPELLRALIELGAKVDVASLNPMRVQPIHSAAAQPDPRKSVELTRMLLDAGADPNARQQAGYTALHEAARKGNLPLIALLLKGGADPEATHDAGLRAIDLARQGGHEDAVRLLESVAR